MSERARVVNVRNEPHDVYVGRPSEWGNPYSEGRDGGRAEVIAKYDAYLEGRPDLLAKLRSLRGKRLGCWCWPQACHADVLARRANALEE